MRSSLIDKIKKVKLLIMDVDGVLTNGEIVIDDKGIETKIFNVQDGFGLVLFGKAGFKTAILSARATDAVKARAKNLNITKVVQAAYPKLAAYKKLVKSLKMKDEHVAFIGDDLPDLAVLKKVGFSVSVPNGVNEVKQIADYITKRDGGKGAVREVIELILKAQGKWNTILEAAGG